MTNSYKVFTRTWWIDNEDWPNGLEPFAGGQRIIARNVASEEEARDIAQKWNAEHDAGRYSLKAEYTDEVAGESSYKEAVRDSLARRFQVREDE